MARHDLQLYQLLYSPGCLRFYSLFLPSGGPRLFSQFESLTIFLRSNMTIQHFNYEPTESRTNVFVFKTDPLRQCVRPQATTKSVVNPAQKPLNLLLYLVSKFSKPDSVVFDLFSGTGTTAVAAALLGRSCVSVDNDDFQLDLVHSRVAAVFSSFQAQAPLSEVRRVEPSLRDDFSFRHPTAFDTFSWESSVVEAADLVDEASKPLSESPVADVDVAKDPSTVLKDPVVSPTRASTEVPLPSTGGAQPTAEVPVATVGELLTPTRQQRVGRGKRGGRGK